MGWTVYYQGSSETPITDEERNILEGHVGVWTKKLEKGSEPYAWKIGDDGKALSGSTKIHFSEDDRGDFVTVIRATQELERLLPRFRFLVSDDYVVTEDTAPSAVEPE